jgi:hypothetical protein
VGSRLKKGLRRWHGGWAGHYHSAEEGDKACYERFDDLLEMVRSQAQGIGAIPVARQAEVDARRQRMDPWREEKLARAYELVRVGMASKARFALIQADLSLDAIARMTDDELLTIPNVGPKSVRQLRDAIAAKGAGV